MTKKPDISDIYSPVQQDLDSVDEWLINITKVNYERLAELLKYSLREGGKKIRPALVLLSGKFYNYDLATLLPMSVSVELLHTATLIHDDAIDNSDVRRGRPTVNVTWNDDKAILLGDYLFATAEEFVARTGNVRVIRLCAETLQVITNSELNQAFNAFNAHQKFDDYVQRISGKTASLLATATESGAILSGAPEESIGILKEYGFNIGIAFQIVDDILDFAGDEKELGKPVGSDLAQGTLTLPAMLLLERYPADNPVARLFENPERKDQITIAIDMVRNSNIVDDCYDVAKRYIRKATADFAKLPDVSGRQSLLQLADFIIERRT